MKRELKYITTKYASLLDEAEIETETSSGLQFYRETLCSISALSQFQQTQFRPSHYGRIIGIYAICHHFVSRPFSVVWFSYRFIYLGSENICFEQIAKS